MWHFEKQTKRQLDKGKTEGKKDRQLRQRNYISIDKFQNLVSDISRKQGWSPKVACLSLKILLIVTYRVSQKNVPASYKKVPHFQKWTLYLDTACHDKQVLWDSGTFSWDTRYVLKFIEILHSWIFFIFFIFYKL